MGDDVLFAGYRSLGTVEIYDQINVTRYVNYLFFFKDLTVAERSLMLDTTLVLWSLG